METSPRIIEHRRVRKGHGVLTVAYHITTTPHELTASEKASRWMPEFGQHITKVERVKIGSHGLVTDEVPNWESPHIDWQTWTVITTEHGMCCITEDENGYHEVNGLIFWGSAFGTSRKSESRTLSTWRKYGFKRGHGMKWLRAMAAQGLCKSPEKGRDICCAEAYDRMAGGTKYRAS